MKKVKVDFAPENKECSMDIPGTYAIYRKKHWWSKWKVVGNTRYADIHIAKSCAYNVPPIFI